MRKLLTSLLVVLSLGTVTFVGCARPPQKATEEEAQQGMDNMDGFEGASDVEGSADPTPHT